MTSDTMLTSTDRFILLDILGLEKNDILPAFSALTDDQKQEFYTKKQRVDEGYPLDYVLNKTPIGNYTFHIPPTVFIPREETELILPKLRQKMDWWMKECKHNKPEVNGMDMCCGTGFLGINIADTVNSMWFVDISKEAVKTTTQNIQENSIQSTRVIHSDLFSSVDLFDVSKNVKDWIFVCNPPYVPEIDKKDVVKNNIQYEPELALFSGEDGLDFFKQCISNLNKFEKKPGFIFFELDPRNVQKAFQCFVERYPGYKAEIWQDCWERERFLVAWIRLN